MIDLYVFPLTEKNAAAMPFRAADKLTIYGIQNAFTYIAAYNGGIGRSGGASASEPFTLHLAAGEYREILRYDEPNSLFMNGPNGAQACSAACAVRAENCEAFRKDTENRALFTVGPKATFVSLKNFTLENTHVKTSPDEALGNQAEAFCFHNQNGVLVAENMQFMSRQDTIHVKGFSRFYRCYVTGDIDYVWGYNNLTLFEECTLHTRQDNRGEDLPAYVLQARTLAGKPGFVFLNCKFSVDPRPTSPVYIARTSGTGSAASADRWDSVALINCTVDSGYDAAFWTDDGGRAVYPERGTALTGWREYGTKIAYPDGSIKPADVRFRHKAGYVLSAVEYGLFYRDRERIVKDTPLASAVRSE